MKDILKEDVVDVPEKEPKKTKKFVNEFDQRKDESQAEYNQRVPVAVQPVRPAPKYSYLGKEL